MLVLLALTASAFQPTLPARGATSAGAGMCWTCDDFNPRSPHGERPDAPAASSAGRCISTHAPRTGSDSGAHACGFFRQISTHAPRTGSDVMAEDFSHMTDEISTHAPRTGSDEDETRHAATSGNFNPRSPHGERRKKPISPRRWKDFNPRSPHGERRETYTIIKATTNFNPRSPHGERPYFSASEGTKMAISTHAPRTGSDVDTADSSVADNVFQPTLPARGATNRAGQATRYPWISTHAPRTGSDGEGSEADDAEKKFQPTLPARGATKAGDAVKGEGSISTHAPRTGSDPPASPPESAPRYFNPRSPHGERRRRDTP